MTTVAHQSLVCAADFADPDPRVSAGEATKATDFAGDPAKVSVVLQGKVPEIVPEERTSGLAASEEGKAQYSRSPSSPLASPSRRAEGVTGAHGLQTLHGVPGCKSTSSRRRKSI